MFPPCSQCAICSWIMRASITDGSTHTLNHLRGLRPTMIVIVNVQKESTEQVWRGGRRGGGIIQRHLVGYHNLGEFALPTNQPMSLQKLNLVSPMGGLAPVEWTRRDYNKNDNTNLSIHNENYNCWGMRPLISPDPHNICPHRHAIQKAKL